MSLAAFVAVAACGGGDGGTGPDPNQVASVVVNPASASLNAIGATTSAFTAQARNAAGATVGGKSFTWTSSAPAIASVDAATGIATAVGNGTATIRATVAGGNTSGTATVTVQQAVNSMALLPTAATVFVGRTLSLNATAADPGGTPIQSPALTWTSSATSVATVSGAGVVTGVAPGSATITASAGSVSAAASISVEHASLTIGQDTTLTGNVTVNQFTVPAGRTVTVTGPLTLVATGRINIGGMMTGSCTPFDISGDTAIMLTGVLTNGCDAGTNAALRLVANGPLQLDGATITSSGNITVSNNPGVAAGRAAVVRRSRAGDVAANQHDGVYFTQVNNTTVRYHGNRGRGAGPNAAPAGANGNPGGAGDPGRAVEFFLDGNAVFAGSTTLWGQDGGKGGDANPPASANNVTATGGTGGRGGKITVAVTGTLTYAGDGNIVRAGRGGNGGNATATTSENAGSGPVAPSATAIGGSAGDPGLIDIRAGGGILINGPTALQLEIIPGDGGTALARGAKGADASGSNAAQIGGDATARGGKGGSTPDEQLDAAGLVQGFPPVITADGGIGGDAIAEAGNGGAGNRQKPHGNQGGNPVATGGEGGDALLRDLTGTLVGFGGGAGRAIYRAGNGGAGWAGCSDNENGGNGGRGGSLGTQVRGRGGRGAAPGPDSENEYSDVGNGGDGGDGVVPGTGGDPGNGPQAPRRLGGPPSLHVVAGDVFTGSTFTRGQDGAFCGLQPNPQPGNNELFMQIAGWPASSQGFISPGTYTRALLSAGSAPVGEAFITTIFGGSFTTYTYRNNPPRIGQPGGQSTGWDLNLASVQENGMFPNTESFTLCFLGENPPPSPANPIVVIQRDNFGVVWATDNITGPGGPIADGRAGCRTFGRHLNATHARWFRGGTGTTEVDIIAFKKKPNP